MSNFRAIATVTITLQRVLQAAIHAEINGATVTTVRPVVGGSTLPGTGVNIFLYQVSPNPHWRNADLPARRQGGELARRPQAALDLHYLLSFYGEQEALEPQQVLGSTVAFLHSQPVLTRDQIEAAVTATTGLAGSDLAEQVDLVRLTPLALSLEELSRLWSVLLQVPYVLSLAYQASVVLIERQLTPRPALPARELNLAAIPLRQPLVESVTAAAGADAPIVPGRAVAVGGQNLRAELMRVEIDGAAVATTRVGHSRIELTLPASLAAGPHSLQVRHGVALGAPGVEHLAFASNLGAFVLRPVVTETGGAYDIDVAGVQASAAGTLSATVTVGVAPEVGPRQTATLELLTAQGGVAHTFLARPRAAGADALVFEISGVSAGEHPMRVRVDGAESPPKLDASRPPVTLKVEQP